MQETTPSNPPETKTEEILDPETKAEADHLTGILEESNDWPFYTPKQQEELRKAAIKSAKISIQKGITEQPTLLTPEQELELLRQENSELKARIQILEQLARKDGLTGLDNRRTFEEEIRREISGAIRTGQPLSIVMYDFDHFKKVNDEHGHPVGDEVLKQASAKVQKDLRQKDRACRYGGEEGIVILPDTTLNQAIGVAERLRHTIETTIIKVHDRKIAISASLGVSTFLPRGSYSEKSQGIIIENITQQLKASTDQAMYEAKSAGRNRTGFMNDSGKIGILEKDPKNSKMIVRYPKLLSPDSPTLVHTGPS